MKKDETEYRPCKKCGSNDYDNADQENFEHTKDGRLVVEPTSCDRCNFELLLSDSDLLH